MALSRSFLSAMGIEEDKINEIISAHTESINGLQSEIEKYKSDAEKLPKVQKELNELKEAQGKDSPYKEKYENEKKAFEDYKKGQEAKEAKAKKSESYKGLLKEAGISDKYLDQLLKASGSDVDTIEFDDKGNVKDAESKVESLKKEWSDFVVVKGKEGADTANPPEGNHGDNHGTERGAELAKSYMAKHGEHSDGEKGKGE